MPPSEGRGSTEGSGLDGEGAGEGEADGSGLEGEGAALSVADAAGACGAEGVCPGTAELPEEGAEVPPAEPSAAGAPQAVHKGID